MTLTVLGAIFGIPMVIIGAGLIGGGRTSATQQVFIIPPVAPAPPSVPPALGTVRDGHQYRLASDGRAYWYRMSDEEMRSHRIRVLEEDLGLRDPAPGSATSAGLVHVVESRTARCVRPCGTRRRGGARAAATPQRPGAATGRPPMSGRAAAARGGRIPARSS